MTPLVPEYGGFFSIFAYHAPARFQLDPAYAIYWPSGDVCLKKKEILTMCVIYAYMTHNAIKQ